MFRIWENLATASLLESNTPDGWIIIDVRDLSDVEKNIEKVKKKIEIISGLLALGEKVCVRCIAGMNRSNAIALGVMCYMSWKGDLDTTWDWHYEKLRVMCPRCQIIPQMERIVRRCLKELDGRK